jgi:hypothetical protein
MRDHRPRHPAPRLWHLPAARARPGSCHRLKPTPGSREGQRLLAPAAPAGAQTVPPAPADGGPRHWEVTGVTSTLNLRAGPTTTAEVLDRLPVGTILSNLGCTGDGGRVWCDVERIAGGPRGFVDAGYLTPAVAPNGAVMTGPDDSALRAGLGEFDATGTIPCAWEEGQPMGQCDFGVARGGARPVPSPRRCAKRRAWTAPRPTAKDSIWIDTATEPPRAVLSGRLGIHDLPRLREALSHLPAGAPVVFDLAGAERVDTSIAWEIGETPAPAPAAESRARKARRPDPQDGGGGAAHARR